MDNGHMTTDWTPGKSAWVRDALESYRMNQIMSKEQARAGDWLSIGQFRALDFFRFNLAAKFHYRFVKQQLTVFGESLLGAWADGAAYADDFQRVQASAQVRDIATWQARIFDTLSKIQRETTSRDVSEGFTILISEMEGASNAREAVTILKQAIDATPETWTDKDGTSHSTPAWNYGLEHEKDGKLKNTDAVKQLQLLITELERTRGFADLKTYLPLPTFAEWEQRSSVFFSFRSSACMRESMP